MGSKISRQHFANTEGLNRAEARVPANLAATLELQEQGYLSPLPSGEHPDVQKWRVTREGAALIRSS